MGFEILFGVVGLGVVAAILSGIRVVNQVERGIVFRFGRAHKRIRQPGLVYLVPFVDRIKRVNVQIITLPIPAQEGITRDNVSVRVDAVVYFRVDDPWRASVEVQNYRFAIEQVAQTSLRSVIGKSDLDDLLSSREQLHRGLELMLDSPALGWGVHIDRVEIKDVQLPESMKRSMSRQAEAERERRARVITADGEFQAAQKLSDASAIMARTPEALQLRLLQTVVEVAAERNSTLVMPLPVEMLRFFDRFGRGGDPPPASQAAAADPPRRDPVDVPPPPQQSPPEQSSPEQSPPEQSLQERLAAAIVAPIAAVPAPSQPPAIEQGAPVTLTTEGGSPVHQPVEVDRPPSS